MLNVELLSVDTSKPHEGLGVFLNTLPRAVRDRVEAIRSKPDRVVSAYAKWLVLSEASKGLSVPMDGLQLAYDALGRPYLPSYEDYYFSVSHCESTIAFVSHSKPIGIDIERVQSRSMPVERRLFTTGEARLVEGSPEPNAQFFRVWTEKESYAKMLGLGLHRAFSTIDTIRLNELGYFRTWALGDYVLTICTEGAMHYGLTVSNVTFK